MESLSTKIKKDNKLYDNMVKIAMKRLDSFQAEQLTRLLHCLFQLDDYKINKPSFLQIVQVISPSLDQPNQHTLLSCHLVHIISDHTLPH